VLVAGARIRNQGVRGQAADRNRKRNAARMMAWDLEGGAHDQSDDFCPPQLPAMMQKSFRSTLQSPFRSPAMIVLQGGLPGFDLLASAVPP